MFDLWFDSLVALGGSLFSRLAYASLWGGLFAAGVWLLTRFAPRLPASVRCFLWWAACAKFVVALSVPAVLELPLLPAPASALPGGENPLVEGAALALAPVGQNARAALPGDQATPSANPPPARGARGKGRALAAVAGVSAWWLVVAAGLLGLAREVHRLRGLLRRADVLVAGPLANRCAELAGRFELARPPVVCLSPEVESPQAVGFTQPRIVLPGPPVAELSAAELDMTLGHELAHLRRGDLWLGWVPAVARRLFWFHPLAALAAREYVLAREVACDAEVLRVLGTAPQDYGRLLLRWGVVPRETGLAAAGAAPSLTSLRRRLEMLQQASTLNRRKALLWGAGAAALVCAAMIPVRIVTAAPPAPVAPAPPVPAVAPVPPAPPAPLAPLAALRAVAPRPAPAPVPPATAPAPPAPPAAAPPPAPPAPPAIPEFSFQMASMAGTSVGSLARSSYRFGIDDGNSWVLLREGHRNTVMSGSLEDLEQARANCRGTESLLYFKRDGKPYVVRDPAFLAEVERLFEPVTRIGQRQAEVGERQAQIGEKQSAIGERQSRVGENQSEIGDKMAAISDRMGKVASRYARANSEERAQLDVEMEKLEAEIETLGRQMERASEPMEKLGEEMEALGGKMETLGDEMEALGQEMEAATERATAAMEALLDAAVRDGRAKSGDDC